MKTYRAGGRECTGGDSRTVACFLTLLGDYQQQHCPQRDLETAGGRGYDGAKNKMQGSGHRTVMTVLRIDRLGFGQAEGAESELILN